MENESEEIEPLSRAADPFEFAGAGLQPFPSLRESIDFEIRRPAGVARGR